ncbi:response regulator [Comamonas sp. JC664]|uniref:hybrid sensor histidine kinase/response regulator n=1 Tax=Comamonas sp. JC664 TaxID=2801917 RepID=UPI00174BB17E|nr:response regulator [Comamonas sp. JC664]MBL0698904.1 response regulator [Comamonas sp. JC664]GHG79464.1 hybrid sensor histidine kinase/response regulator [Comamonas sp. KCTC 72670]
MDRDRLAQALLATFLEELEGHIVSLNRELLALERETAPARMAELVASLLRTLHSVKGAARAASATLVETACHRMEEVLEGVRDAGAGTAEVFELCFTTVDALDDAGRRLAARQELVGSPLEALLPQLERAAAPPASSRGRAPATAATVPALDDVAHPARAPLEPTPPASAEPPSPQEPPPAAPAGVDALPVRVSAQKLDALLARSGELRVATLRLEGRAEALESVREALAQAREAVLGTPGEQALLRAETELSRVTMDLAADRRTLGGVATGLDDEVRRARTLSFEEGCEGLERAARDVARSLDRQVRLEIHGGALELDRSLLQGLREPLLHLVRNAVAHGLESPEERERQGKPPEGRLTLSARLKGSRVEVTVDDDGRGLNLAALRERARARGLKVPEDDEEAARLVFLPGLSTAVTVTQVAGRGVGLDVVRMHVEGLRGSVEVTTLPDRGTCFTLDVPLTLSTLRVLLVSAGGQILALASESVARLVRLSPGEVRDVEGRPAWASGDALVPLASLADVLGLPPGPPRTRRGAVVLASGTARAVVVVDEVLAEQEALVRSLGHRVRRARHVSAAAVLPDGRLSLLLNPVSLVRAAGGRPAASLFPAPAAQRTRRRVVLADDSPTTRALEQSILESAGYEVVACVDGADAWERLQAGGADALVLDVEMPRMDGFSLTEAVRASPRFSRLPVVLVTARGKAEDKARGLQAGASAYLVKSAFDPTSLLETLRRLL